MDNDVDAEFLETDFKPIRVICRGGAADGKSFVGCQEMRGKSVRVGNTPYFFSLNESTDGVLYCHHAPRGQPFRPGCLILGSAMGSFLFIQGAHTSLDATILGLTILVFTVLVSVPYLSAGDRQRIQDLPTIEQLAASIQNDIRNERIRQRRDAELRAKQEQKRQERLRRVEEWQRERLENGGTATEEERLRVAAGKSLSDDELLRKAELEADPAVREKWSAYCRARVIRRVDEMSGIQFELFLQELLQKIGFTEITLTPVSTDQGGDLICKSPAGEKCAVQAKRWNSTIGNEAVQQVLAAMLYYDCIKGLVITNSTFTQAAMQLASKDPRITLYDRKWLLNMISGHFPITSIHPFDMDEYNRVVKWWAEYKR